MKRKFFLRNDMIKALEVSPLKWACCSKVQMCLAQDCCYYCLDYPLENPYKSFHKMNTGATIIKSKLKAPFSGISIKTTGTSPLT